MECTPAAGEEPRVVVTLRVVYQRATDAEDARPIVFHTYVINTGDLQIDRYENDEWKACDDTEQGCAAGVDFDGADLPINVSNNEHFICLHPSSSWTSSWALSIGEGLPDDTRVGDVFRFRHEGGAVDWWDWGDAAQHANTVVQIPSWIMGRVTNPRDNGGRPKLVVPDSDYVECTLVSG
jgi:hypothetical protein